MVQAAQTQAHKGKTALNEAALSQKLWEFGKSGCGGTQPTLLAPGFCPHRPANQLTRNKIIVGEN